MSHESLHLKIEPLLENEVVIRQGEARPLHTPQPLTLKGDFSAPAQFVQKRQKAGTLDEYPDKEVHVLFNKKNLSITLEVGEQEAAPITVVGILRKHPFLESLKLPEGQFTKDSLLKLIRMKGRYFADRDKHKELIAKLQRFDVSTQTNFKDENDRRGQTNAQLQQTAKSDLTGFAFDLRVPLFEGHQAATIPVTVEVEPNNGTVNLYLVSESFEEQWETAVEAQFIHYRPVFEPYVIIEQS